MKKFLGRLLETFGLIFSVIWLIFATTFVSGMWEEHPAMEEWNLSLPYVPIGFVMIALWIIALTVLLIMTNAKDKKKKSEDSLTDM